MTDAAKPKSKGIQAAEAQLLAMASQGVKAEVELRVPRPPAARPPEAKDEGHDDEAGGGQAERSVRRKFGFAQVERPAEPEEAMTKKISPNVRPSTWLAVRKLELRLEELGDNTSLNALTDSALRTMVSEMNAGLDGRVDPDAYELAVEAMGLLRECQKAGSWTADIQHRLDALEVILDAL